VLLECPDVAISGTKTVLVVKMAPQLPKAVCHGVSN
jgi:hypothetical protein